MEQLIQCIQMGYIFESPCTLIFSNFSEWAESQSCNSQVTNNKLNPHILRIVVMIERIILIKQLKQGFQDFQLFKSSALMSLQNYLYLNQEMEIHSSDEICFSQSFSQVLRIPIHNEDQFGRLIGLKQEKREGLDIGQNGVEVRGRKVDKKKPVKKRAKAEKGKYQKRKKDQSITVPMGRPDNCGPEVQHLKQNKSYNDIVYHYSRFLIFLKMRQGSEKIPHALNLTYKQNECMMRAEQIMSEDNFPQLSDQRPCFLLHPNSPHFVLDFLKKREGKVNYSSEEIQYIMIAYLKKKGLLTSSNYTYLCDYWKDIIYLVNNPRGGVLPESVPDDSEVDAEDPVEIITPIQNNENIDVNGRKNKKESAPSQNRLLQEQLKDDDTIAAYEIACYLHACCDKYNIKIEA